MKKSLAGLFIAGVLSAAVIGIIQSRSDAAANAPRFAVMEKWGYIRLKNVKVGDEAKFLSAAHGAAAGENWKQASMEGMPGDGQNTRTEFVYRDTADTEIRVNWISEVGGDARIVVSAAPQARESATKAIWAKLMPQVTR